MHSERTKGKLSQDCSHGVPFADPEPQASSCPPCADSRESWQRPGGKAVQQGSPSRSSMDTTSKAAAGAGPSAAPAPNTPRPARQQLASVYQMRMQGGTASSSTLQPGSSSCRQEAARRLSRAPADLAQTARAGAVSAAQGPQPAARSQGGDPQAGRSPWGSPSDPARGQQQVLAEANGGGVGLGLLAADGPPPPPPPRQQHLRGGLHRSSTGGTWSLGSPNGIVAVSPGMMQSLLPPVPVHAGQQPSSQHQHSSWTHTSPQLDPLGGLRLLQAGQQAPPLPAGLAALEQQQQPAALLQAPGGGAGLAAGGWLPASPLQGQVHQSGARQEQPSQGLHSAHWQVSSVLLSARVCNSAHHALVLKDCVVLMPVPSSSAPGAPVEGERLMCAACRAPGRPQMDQKLSLLQGGSFTRRSS